MQINKGEDKQVQLEPITAQAEFFNVNKTQVVNIPGKEVITQPVVQEYYQQNDVHHIQKPVFDKVEINRYVPLPTPFAQKVPVIRRIPVPVAKKLDESFTHRVQIGIPDEMTRTSASVRDDVENSMESSEDYVTLRKAEKMKNDYLYQNFPRNDRIPSKFFQKDRQIKARVEAKKEPVRIPAKDIPNSFAYPPQGFYQGGEASWIHEGLNAENKGFLGSVRGGTIESGTNFGALQGPRDQRREIDRYSLSSLQGL